MPTIEDKLAVMCLAGADAVRMVAFLQTSTFRQWYRFDAEAHESGIDSHRIVMIPKGGKLRKQASSDLLGVSLLARAYQQGREDERHGL